MEQHQNRPIDSIDGLKLHLDHGEWVHLSPNPEKPRFEIVAEAENAARAGELAVYYRQCIETLLQENNGSRRQGE